jgi:hypothetical protein
MEHTATEMGELLLESAPVVIAPEIKMDGTGESADIVEDKRLDAPSVRRHTCDQYGSHASLR